MFYVLKKNNLGVVTKVFFGLRVCYKNVTKVLCVE